MIKAVLFDFDETLQDRTKAFKKYMDTFFNHFFSNLNKEETQKMRDDLEKTGNGGYVKRQDWYNQLVSLWNWTNAPTLEEFSAFYDEQLGLHNAVFEESLPLLKELKKRGYITGVVTNGPTYLQHTKLEKSGLLPYCDILVVSGDLEYAKPDKRIFEYTAQKLDLKPCECVYVGDHPINDIKGSLDSGMKAIRMNWGWFKDENLREDVPVIDNIYNVIDVLEKQENE